ncbi:MAG: family 78 glycoside hydrolase catalytic domain, partial [Anaerolineae bacterium]
MADQLTVGNLRCAYRVNPLGIDIAQPRLSWELASDRRGVRQSAYQIVVREGDDVLWDTERVESDQSIQVPYEGPVLRSRQRVNWQVRVWDQDGQPSPWSERAWWEMGLLDADDWQAEWIEPDWQVNTETSQPCPYLRRAWSLGDGEIASARLYITAHGLYEASINGQVVTEDVFTPGWTSYHQRLQYQAYDVTELLHAGENVLGVILGDGWWRGKVGVASYRNVWGARLALLAQLEVTYADGRQVRILSDEDWQATRGPILASDLKDGEVYDARREMPGWDAPGFNAQGWNGVRVADHGYTKLVASNSVPVRRHERFRPLAILKTPSGETVADMGQNMAGRVRLRVQGPAGTTVTLTHGEALDEHGNFTIAHLQMPMAGAELQQRVQYTLKGDGVEDYEPRFTFHGFRYVKVEGWPGELRHDHLEGIAIYSAMPEGGEFACSDQRVNQLVHNTLWSMKSNFLDVPTDCPTRERAGWTGDAQIFCRTGSYLMDTAAFFDKWLADLATEQRDDGRVTNLVPDPVKHVPPGMLTGLEGSAGWGDAAVIIPWTLYQIYGDESILARQYDSMRAWVEYERAHAERVHWRKKLNPAYWLSKGYRQRQEYLWDTDYHWGEWLEPGGMGPLTMVFGMLKRKWFGAPSVATAFYAHSAGLLARAARVLGKEDDAATYQRLH